MKQIDILFLSMDISSSDMEYRGIPLGIAYLAGQIKARGMSYKVLDFYNYGIDKKAIKVLTNSIKFYRPRVIGISSSAYYLRSLKAGITRIRKIARSLKLEIPIIIGGYICLIEDALKITQADVLCYGEGDKTIVELMEYFLGKKNALQLSEIKGIMYRENKDYIKTAPRDLITDLDSLEFPAFEEFDMKYYNMRNSLPFYTQRGCYNHCKFCDIADFYGKKYIRRMSPEKVIQMIKSLKNNYDFEIVEFMDDNFLNSPKFVRKLFNLINLNFLKDDYTPEIQINFQTRADDVLRFKELLIANKRFISSLEIGIESFSQSQLDRWNKNTTMSQNIECIKFLSDTKIPYEINLLWIDRETTIKELRENVEILLSLPEVPVFKNHSINTILIVPNLVKELKISTVYNNRGESTVKHIPYLDAAEKFLNNTYKNAKRISDTYLNLKYILSNHKSKRDKENIEKYFPIAEDTLKKRLLIMLDLTCRIKNLNFKSKSPVRFLIKKTSKQYNKTTENFLNSFKKSCIIKV